MKKCMKNQVIMSTSPEMTSQENIELQDYATISKFQEHLEEKGLFPREIIISNDIQRFSTNSADDLTGYFQLLRNEDGFLGGYYGDWRTNQKGIWLSHHIKTLSKSKQKKFKLNIEDAHSIEIYHQKKLQERAAQKAQKQWSSATEVNADNIYLKTKQIKSYGLRQAKKIIMIPLINNLGKIQSLQYINDNGQKSFLKDGLIHSHFFQLQGKKESIVICKDYESAASVHEATGYNVVVTFISSNFIPVAQKIRGNSPRARIIIVGNNEQIKSTDIQKTDAYKAAKKIDADFVIPTFKTNPPKSQNFNALRCLEGLDAVRDQINSALPLNNTNESPYVCKSDGVYFISTDEEDNIKFEYICSPISILAMTRNIDSEDWGRLLEIQDPDKIIHRWSMPMHMTSKGDACISHLLSLGLHLSSEYNSKYRLYDYLTSTYIEKRVLCVPRIGWHGDLFVLPSSNYGNSEEEVVLQSLPTENLFTQLGTLAEWKSNIGQYCVGNNRLQFAVSSAFAAPLLELIDLGSGGFNFVGDSSVGKSTLAKVAGSICGGGGLHGFITSWRATDNALEAIAVNHCDCLLVLDDMGQAPPNIVGAASYMLANGQGKARSNKYATNSKASEWRLLILSTSEVTLQDKIQEDGRNIMGGQSVRILDIPADAGKGMGIFEDLHDAETAGEFSIRLQAASNSYYGTPFHHYMNYVARNKQETLEFINNSTKMFIDKYLPQNSCGQIHRAFARYALVAAAGELAIFQNILPWPEGSAIEATKSCMNAWLARRGGTESLEIQNGLAQVRQFFQVHGATRFERLGEDSYGKIYNRAGYSIKKNNERLFLVFPEVFKNEICKGFNHTKICQAAIAKHWIKPQHPHHTQRLRNPNGRFYVFTNSVICGDTGDTGDSVVESASESSPV